MQFDPSSCTVNALIFVDSLEHKKVIILQFWVFQSPQWAYFISK